MEEKEALAEQLTPVQIKNKEFNKSLWGYTPKEVVQFLDQVANQIERLQVEERQLLNKIKLLEEELGEWKSKEQDLLQLREGAKLKAKEIEDQATQDATNFLKTVQDKAEKIRSKTEEWLEKIILEVERTENKKQQFLTSLKSTLDEHYEILKNEEGRPKLDLDLEEVNRPLSSH